MNTSYSTSKPDPRASRDHVSTKARGPRVVNPHAVGMDVGAWEDSVPRSQAAGGGLRTGV